MGNKKTVCAVVVTYNRKHLLLECLDSLLKQTRPINALYIIDNASSDGTYNMLFEKGYIGELLPQRQDEPWESKTVIQNKDNSEDIYVYYVRMQENTGGAGGFHEGVKRGYKKGYDWLWLMDDDAQPEVDSLFKLESYFNRDDVVALSNSVVKENGEFDLMHRGLIDFSSMFPSIQKPIDMELYNNSEVEIHTASFVGLLVAYDAIKEVGFPKKEFFIHNDDIEYCLRLTGVGKLLLIPSSKIKHKEVATVGHSRVPFDKLWLRYYGLRNLIGLNKKYGSSNLRFYFSLLKNTIGRVCRVIVYDDNKVRRLRFIFNQIGDGLSGNFDNSKPKKILYE